MASEIAVMSVCRMALVVALPAKYCMPCTARALVMRSLSAMCSLLPPRLDAGLGLAQRSFQVRLAAVVQLALAVVETKTRKGSYMVDVVVHVTDVVLVVA